MRVLLLALSGPLQSWGDSSRFAVRQTRREPTKSGVIGLAAAALGRDRDAPLDDLCAFEYGVRVDQPGTIVRDFQTERSMDGKKVMPLSQRYYLADAKFLVALGGPDDALSALEAALLAPAWPLYLGRRSCPPDGPLVKMAAGGPYKDVREALRTEPWIAADWYKERLARQVGEVAFPELEVTCDARDGEAYEVCSDVPLGFGEVRRYRERRVARFWVPNPSAPDATDEESEVPASPASFGEHDPMAFF